MKDDAWWGCQLMAFQSTRWIVYCISIASLLPKNKRVSISPWRRDLIERTEQISPLLGEVRRACSCDAVERLEFILCFREIGQSWLVKYYWTQNMHVVCVVSIQMRERRNGGRFFCLGKFLQQDPQRAVFGSLLKCLTCEILLCNRTWFYITVHILPHTNSGSMSNMLVIGSSIVHLQLYCDGWKCFFLFICGRVSPILAAESSHAEVIIVCGWRLSLRIWLFLFPTLLSFRTSAYSLFLRAMSIKYFSFSVLLHSRVCEILTLVPNSFNISFERKVNIIFVSLLRRTVKIKCFEEGKSIFRLHLSGN